VSACLLVNISVLLLRRDRIGHRHFSVPSWVPVLGAVTCLALITQFKADIFARAAILVALGFVLWGVNVLLTRRLETGPVPGHYEA
jgi:hypothetical protein